VVLLLVGRQQARIEDEEVKMKERKRGEVNNMLLRQGLFPKQMYSKIHFTV
jgi:hypothetical protein